MLYQTHRADANKTDSAQGCALAVPCDPWCLTFAPRCLENFLVLFGQKSDVGTPDFTGSIHWAPSNFSKSTALVLEPNGPVGPTSTTLTMGVYLMNNNLS